MRKRPTLEIAETQPNEGADGEATEPGNRDLPNLITKALNAFETSLQNEKFKPSLAEYLKLLQFEQDLKKHDDKPKEIKVTWVEPELISSEE